MTQDTDPKAVEALALAGLEADEQRTELLDVAINTGTYDKRTHVAVPIEPTAMMWVAMGYDTYAAFISDYTAMLRAAEGEE